MLVPALHTTSRIFAATLAVNMLCSMIFWHKGSWGGAWHLADRAASCATLVQTLNAPVLSAVPVLGFSAWLGQRCLHRREYGGHLVVHLFFRYVAFWICCVYAEHVDPWLVAMYTVLYVCQCVPLFILATHRVVVKSPK